MDNSIVAVATTGGYRRSQIEHVCMPGETYIIHDRVTNRPHSYTNQNNEPTYILINHGIVPRHVLISFKSEHEAEIFFLKQELESTKKKLESERKAHQKAVARLAKVQDALNSIRV